MTALPPEAAFDDADLNGFVDGRIDPSRGTALAASLASDPAARARIEAWRRQGENLRTMFAGVLAEPIPVRLLPVAVAARDAAAAREAPPARDAGAGRDGAKRGWRVAGALASTSLGMALVGFALGVLASVGTDGFGLAPASDPGPGSAGRVAPAGSGPGDLASRAAETHRTFLTDPAHAVEIPAGEEPKLLRWMRHRVGSTLRIPDLARQGWVFLGGRIVPGPGGPAAFLAYGSGGDRLGLLVSRSAGQADGRVSAADDEEHPLGVAAWGDGGYGFALTADRGRDWLSRNIGPLRESVRAQAGADGGPAFQP